MTAEIVNLRKARKARIRREAEVQAAENRSRFGRPKAEREAREALEHLAERRLEGHRLGPVEVPRDVEQPRNGEGSGTPDRPA